MAEYEIPNGRPLGTKILIKLLPKKEKTQGGIILTDLQANPLVEAVAILVGDECKAVKQFDKLLVPNGAGVEHTIEGNNYKFIQESDPFYIL